MIEINKNILNFLNECEGECAKVFLKIDEIEFKNQLKVLNAFNSCKVQSRHFIGSTGYGHNDIGKEKACELLKTIFNTEDAFISPLISCGTEAISQSLFGILRPGDNMLCISGTPYDTLKKVIFGVEGKNIGSLKDYNIGYDEVDLVDENFDTAKIIEMVKENKPKVIYIQRSRGYTFRNALTVKKIGQVIADVKKATGTKAYFVVDNCYGEFCEESEPTDVGADLVIGSLLKNMGGGIASTGGYMAGKSELIELISYKITSPALGTDIGSFEQGYKQIFEGIFVAPHVVAQAKKVAILTAVALNKLGYQTKPNLADPQADIVCCIKFGDKDKLVNFTRAIQYSSAIDSDSTLEAGEMDGYEDLIIMASGSFNQGSSIELSCDGPMRPPYTAYLQGGLSYAHGKIGLTNALSTIWKN